MTNPSQATVRFERIKAVTFDVYGTLIDWESSIPKLISPWLRESGVVVSDELILSTFAANQKRHQIVRPALRYTEVLRRTYLDLESSFGLEPDEGRAIQFSHSVGAWDAFDDTVAALRQLNTTCLIGILSNVDNESFERTRPKLGVPLAIKVTAEDVGSYKPDVAHFEESLRQCRELGIGKQELLHVAWSRHHDVEPCQKLGLASVWIDRRHGKKGPGATMPSDAVPDLTLKTLAELAALHRAACR